MCGYEHFNHQKGNNEIIAIKYDNRQHSKHFEMIQFHPSTQTEENQQAQKLIYKRSSSIIRSSIYKIYILFLVRAIQLAKKRNEKSLKLKITI